MISYTLPLGDWRFSMPYSKDPAMAGSCCCVQAPTPTACQHPQRIHGMPAIIKRAKPTRREQTYI